MAPYIQEDGCYEAVQPDKKSMNKIYLSSTWHRIYFAVYKVYFNNKPTTLMVVLHVSHTRRSNSNSSIAL